MGRDYVLCWIQNKQFQLFILEKEQIDAPLQRPVVRSDSLDRKPQENTPPEVTLKRKAEDTNPGRSYGHYQLYKVNKIYRKHFT